MAIISSCWYLILCATSVQAYCNWNNCNGEVQGGELCNENEDQCIRCGGGSQWCGNDGGDSSLTKKQASTTRYWDCSGGSCGCGYLHDGQSDLERHCNSNALFAAPQNNEHGAKFYGAAAISATLGGGEWLAEGCGKCFKVTGTSNIPGNSGVTTTLVLKATNYCPPGNPSCNGKAHFDIAAPGFDYAGATLWSRCSAVAPEENDAMESCGNWMITPEGTSKCNCDLFSDPVLRAGCKNFLSLHWNNPTVEYEEINCPIELAQLPCWADNGGGWPIESPELCSDPFALDSPPVTTSQTPPPPPPSTTTSTTTTTSVQPPPPPSTTTTSTTTTTTTSTQPPPPPSTTTSTTTTTSTQPPPPPSTTTSTTTTTSTQPPPPPTSTTSQGTPSGFCCSWNGVTCGEALWCNQQQSNCSTCGGMWLDPVSSSCRIQKWGECTNDVTGCCAGSCQGGQYYKQCK